MPSGIQAMRDDIVPGNGDGTHRRRRVAGHHPHCGRFPGAIGAKEANYFTLFNMQRHIYHGGVSAKHFRHVFEFDH